MGAAKPLVSEITHYLRRLNTEQQKAVLTVVKTFAAETEQDYSPWKDAGFVTELDRRVAELQSGKVKGRSWEEVKQRARQSLKGRKKK